VASARQTAATRARPSQTALAASGAHGCWQRRALGRRTAPGGEIRVVMPTDTTHVEQLERHLLRRGVGALEADRDRCADCGRTPLTGEHVHLYDGRGGEVVCELCRTLRREAPVASEIVRHCEHGHTVRLTARAA
jgi:hypothetical protein